ncbi:MAG: ExbD/TolR family protein [Chthoniobacterales bacterium]
MAGSAGGGGNDPEFQIAPMIDVLLVLLIFFMSITTAQVLKVDKTITLPVAADAIKKDNSRSEAIVNIRWDEATRKPTYVINETEITDTGDLTKALTAARKIGETKVARGPNPTFRVVIRGDKMCTARSVTAAMNSAAEAGISDISFSAINHE